MSKINLEINFEENKWLRIFPDVEKIMQQAVGAALDGCGIARQAVTIEISVLLTNDASILELNHKYRNKNKATNVLSFPQEDFIAGEYSNISGGIAIGDIIFALETILQEAAEQEKNPLHHLTHLAVHGTLHLLGYNHEDEAEAATMEALEINILAGLGIGSPY